MKKMSFAIAMIAALACSGIVVSAEETPNTEEIVIVTPEDWKEKLPDLVASYEKNAENSYAVDYLEESPYLVNIYEGYGFAKDYSSARGHAYVLEDVGKTERPHALANCLTCKTADFTKLVNDLGEDAYSLEFEALYPQMTQNVGCYSCHENTPVDGLALTHDYTVAAIGDEMEDSTIAPAVAVCGQCHTEYYFNPDNKATKVPYTDIASMDPAAELAYYDEMGFSDWTQDSTGAAMLKVQHPEIETYLGEGSVHAGMGLTCADCHMESTSTEYGAAYHSHYFESPLENEKLLETCAACHKDTDMTEKVHAIQEEITARESEVGEKLSGLKDQLADAVAGGKYTEDELDAIRKLYRTAQWYFDYDYVENSEGAHNSTLAKRCLDTAEETIDEAMKLFKEA